MEIAHNMMGDTFQVARNSQRIEMTKQREECRKSLIDQMLNQMEEGYHQRESDTNIHARGQIPSHLNCRRDKNVQNNQMIQYRKVKTSKKACLLGKSMMDKGDDSESEGGSSKGEVSFGDSENKEKMKNSKNSLQLNAIL